MIGDKCDVPIYAPLSDKSEGSQEAATSNGGLIAGLVVSTLLIVMVIAALTYYRRRISYLKSELAQVQYIADPSSAPGTVDYHSPRIFTTCFRFLLLFSGVQGVRN